MFRLRYEYRMEMTYSEPAKKAHFSIRCMPKDTLRQRIVEQRIELDPPCRYSTGTDGFGNLKLYGTVDVPHTSFVYRISGTAEIDQVLYEEKEEGESGVIFRFPTALTRPGEMLRGYHERLTEELAKSGITQTYNRLIYLMRRLHEDMSYVPGATTLHSTAEEAMGLGQGVCQDYAHIFIAIARLMGIPARYVTGLLIGEGESHAWVECLCGDVWIGIDPTNNLVTDHRYIKVSHGRDAADCQINRGILIGGGMQTQKIAVTVREE